ncbi:MAG: class I SAM-dependent methyltransferase [Actinomycetes bacterium]
MRSATQETALVLTGERTLPAIPDENYWFRRHEAAYRAVVPFVTGAVALDAGCGEGYGAELMARTAGDVLALDYDALTAAHVHEAYPTVDVVRGDLQHLPLGDGSIDVVVCMQVIEHLWDQPGFVAECARVLRPAGTFIVSTPNRLTFSPSGQVLNPFHTRELAADELAELLAQRFVVTRLYGLRHGRRLARFERRRGSLVETQTAGPPDSWPAPVRRLVQRVRVKDFVVDEKDVDASLDLIVVARKRTVADT